MLPSSLIESYSPPDFITIPKYEQEAQIADAGVERSDIQRENTKDFTEVLEELRSTRQVSKKELALRANLSSGYISLLTSGARKAPSEETVAALADALSLDINDRLRLFEAAGFPSHYASLNFRTGNVKADWGEAPNVQVFYGRKKQLEELEKWIVRDHCQLVSVLGMGGIGKTMLAAKLAETIQNTFEYVFWRSLQHAPSVQSILKEYIQLFSYQPHNNLPDDVDELISILIEYLREHRCLIVLDNFESILEAGTTAGHYRPGFEGYGQLLQRIGEVKHKSCLLLTSREKLREIPRLEGKRLPVRSMHLIGVEIAEAEEILKDENLQGTDETWERFVKLYGGNPLALKLACEPIQDRD